MERRLRLHDVLVNILGSNHVYFQIPDKVRLSYPCIVYSIDNIDSNFANDRPYTHKTRYLIKLIDSNIESQIRNKILALPTCKFVTQYVYDNLYHFLFNIYF